MPTTKSADAIVVGGGLAGLAAACAVAGCGLRTIHLAPPMPKDHRTSALMMPSVRIMQQLGLIDTPDDLGEPLRTIRIIDATDRLLRAPEALFDSSEVAEEAFGWNFANARLSARFEPLAEKLPTLSRRTAMATGLEPAPDTGWQITLSQSRDTGEKATHISAPLIIGADGKQSFVRQSAGISISQTRHKQSALVCDLTLEYPLHGESVEYHCANGPFTLVPAGGLRANLVWVDNHDVLSRISKMDATEQLAAIQARSRNLFGQMTLETPTFVFPLSSHTARSMGKDGILLVGESGHAFPPIGAQGLNLSLRDVKTLVDLLSTTDAGAPGWATKLSEKYDSARRSDIRRTSGMVDTLFRSLLSEMLPAQALRTGGIWALKTVPPLRRFAFQMGMGRA